MEIATREWGTLQVADELVVHLASGLFGFEGLRRFVLVDIEELRPFVWFLSVDEPEVGFAVADPQYFWTGPYQAPLSEGDEALLDLEAGDPIAVFVIATIEPDGQITGNLRGPIVLNTRNRLAKQVIAFGSTYAVRQPMLTHPTVPLHGALGKVPTRA